MRCCLGTVHMYSICRQMMLVGKSSLVSKSLTVFVARHFNVDRLFNVKNAENIIILQYWQILLLL